MGVSASPTANRQAFHDRLGGQVAVLNATPRIKKMLKFFCIQKIAIHLYIQIL